MPRFWPRSAWNLTALDTRPHDWTWIEARETVGFCELGRTCALTPQELDELIEFGALVPLGRNEPSGGFSGSRRSLALLNRDS